MVLLDDFTVNGIRNGRALSAYDLRLAPLHVAGCDASSPSNPMTPKSVLDAGRAERGAVRDCRIASSGPWV